MVRPCTLQCRSPRTLLTQPDNQAATILNLCAALLRHSMTSPQAPGHKTCGPAMAYGATKQMSTPTSFTLRPPHYAKTPGEGDDATSTLQDKHQASPRPTAMLWYVLRLRATVVEAAAFCCCCCCCCCLLLLDALQVAVADAHSRAHGGAHVDGLPVHTLGTWGLVGVHGLLRDTCRTHVQHVSDSHGRTKHVKAIQRGTLTGS
jgi:hypothetical protein